MDIKIFQRIQRNLVQKRHNIDAWLAGAPASQKHVRLGPSSEDAIETHLQVIDKSIEQVSEHKLGICRVCNDYVNPSLLEMDYTSCVCLEHLSEHDRRQLELELEFTQQVQRAQLPQQVPEIPGMGLAVFSRPAQFVSGDYFDFLEFNDGSPGLAIADAMGHGMSAGLIVNSLQTALRTLVPESSSASEVLQRVNRYYLHNSQFTTFVTVFLAQYNPSSHRLTYCNAGHNPPALYRSRTKEIEWLEPNGAALGLVENNLLTSRTIPFNVGDILLLYTDGVVETVNSENENFGSARLAQALHQNPGLPAVELVHAIRRELLDFTGQSLLEDDITLVAGKVGYLDNRGVESSD
jgi:serine phosphatase RsbU (regulator of sigma subunit)